MTPEQERLLKAAQKAEDEALLASSSAAGKLGNLLAAADLLQHQVKTLAGELEMLSRDHKEALDLLNAASWVDNLAERPHLRERIHLFLNEHEGFERDILSLVGDDYEEPEL